MQLKLLLLVASMGSALAIPVEIVDAEKNAVINTRFGTYDAEKRDLNTKPENAVLNSRFGTYEAEKRDVNAESNNAVINSRFGKYQAE
jgi:hypothetical protein